MPQSGRSSALGVSDIRVPAGHWPFPPLLGGHGEGAGEGLPGAESPSTPAAWGAGRLTRELGFGHTDSSWGWLAKRVGAL